MKKNTLLTMLFTVALIPALISCGDVGDASKAETGDAVDVKEGVGGTFAIDTANSKVSWKAAKVTNAHDGGFHTFSGTVSVDDGKVNNTTVTIDPASIYSDNEKLTGHLMTPDFFNVEQYKTAKFEASEFKPVDSTGFTHMVTGNLTMLDKTNSITFPANISVTDNMITAKADFIIDRQNWGISYTGMQDDLINDEVRIIFDIQAPVKAEGDMAEGETAGEGE